MSPPIVMPSDRGAAMSAKPSTFKIGDRVVVIEPDTDLFGAVTTVTSDLHPAAPCSRPHHAKECQVCVPAGTMIYTIDIRDKEGRPYGAMPSEIEPYYPDCYERTRASALTRRIMGIKPKGRASKGRVQP